MLDFESNKTVNEKCSRILEGGMRDFEGNKTVNEKCSRILERGCNLFHWFSGTISAWIVQNGSPKNVEI